MSMLPTAPRSIGGVLDNAMRIYRKSLFPCFPIVLVASLATAVPSTMLALQMGSVAGTDNPQAMLDLFQSPDLWLMYLAMMVVGIIAYGALFARIDAIARGQSMSMGSAVGAGLRRFPVLLAVSILLGLMVGIGTVLLIIPGIVLWGYFQLAMVAAVLERNGVFGSFGTSARLVSGNWWRTNVTIFVAFVMMLVLFVVIATIAGIFAGFFGAASAGSGASPADVADDLVAFQLVQQGLSAVLNVFVMTFFPSVLLAVFYDLKLRKEGADLATRVGELNPAS